MTLFEKVTGSEIQISKPEIRNNIESQKGEMTEKPDKDTRGYSSFRSLQLSDFEFVSSFDIRISDLPSETFSYGV